MVPTPPSGGGPGVRWELCRGNMKEADASSLLCYSGAAPFIIQTYSHSCHLTSRMRRCVLGEGKSNYHILYNWTLNSKVGSMRELTFPALLIFATRSSHSHSAPVNQQYADDVTQQPITRHVASHRQLTQSLDNVTDFPCLFLSSVLISSVSVW